MPTKRLHPPVSDADIIDVLAAAGVPEDGEARRLALEQVDRLRAQASHWPLADVRRQLGELGIVPARVDDGR